MPRSYHRVVPLSPPVVIGSTNYSRFIDTEAPLFAATIVADVTGASTGGGGPILLSSTLRTGFAALSHGTIVVSGVLGNTAANGTWGISSGEPIASVNNATPIGITTGTPHYLASGMTVSIPSTCGNANAIGSWVVTVTSSTTFTLNGSSGGTAAGACDPYVVVGGVVLIGSVGNGAYTGSGTVTRNEIIGQIGSAVLLADGAQG